MGRLETPHPRWHESYVAAVREFQAESEDGLPANGYRNLPIDRLAEPPWFEWHLELTRREAFEDTPRPEHLVPQTTLWWIDGDQFIGRLTIRHRLTEQLRTLGGHIGYDVRPSARRRGHATNMLHASLPFTQQLGIDPALLTCNVTNHASRRVIEINGGIFEQELNGKYLFWVPTS